MIKIETGLSLRDFSTFRIGGEVAGLVRIKNEEDLQAFFQLINKEKRDFFILGGGSNVLFRDDYWHRLVAKIENDQKLVFKNEKIICGAGVTLAKLVNYAYEEGLTGLEWAVGIPGTVGGAIRGNAGAFGGQMADSVEQVVAWEWKEGVVKKRTFLYQDCRFGYRESLFKEEKNFLIWEVKLSLNFGKKEAIRKRMAELLMQRKKTQPKLNQFPSLGSIFKNPMAPKEIIALFEKEKQTKVKNHKVPAGWLIEKCKLKGQRIGDAQVSQLQANFIVNLGQAKANEVQQLITLIKEKVWQEFRIQLEEEIEIC